MHNPDPHANVSIDCDPGKAAEAAEMVRRDFSALLKVFEEQLAISSDNEVERRVHINEARSAAERGIKLSKELIDMLRSRTS
jgi:hypothetical protein